MTRPTQAQIEAVALELSSEHPWPWECCLEIARLRSLTAAAEVGEEEKQTRTAQMWLQAEKELETIEASTIERCAQVAESYIDPRDAWANLPGKIAAAIRALKG